MGLLLLLGLKKRIILFFNTNNEFYLRPESYRDYESVSKAVCHPERNEMEPKDLIRFLLNTQNKMFRLRST